MTRAAFPAAFAAAYRAFGVPATYGAGEVSVILTTNLAQWGNQINVAHGRVALRVRKSEVPDRPARGATFTVDE